MRRYAREAVIGLLPAAGHARRIAPLPCSKELLPLWADTPAGRPRPVCAHALEQMRRAGIERAFVAIREGKWDIPAYLGSGPTPGLSVAYLLSSLPYGVPFTLDVAYPFMRTAPVALAFPDILFRSDDAFARLLEALDRDGVDAVLGLFPADRPQTMDMVELDGARVRRIVVKPEQTRLRLTWGIAVWSPTFTQFMHDHLAALQSRGDIPNEVHQGDVFQAAIDAGLRVHACPVSDEPYLDVGTPEGLRRARLRIASEPDVR